MKEKIIYYFSMIAINMVAAFLIGISFLAGPPNLSEKELAQRSVMFRIPVPLRLLGYGLMISAAVAGAACLLNYLFRNVLSLDKHSLKKVFWAEFIVLTLIFAGAHLVIFFLYES